MNDQQTDAEPETPQSIVEQQQEQASYRSDSESRTAKLASYWTQLKKFGKECRRVLKVTQKPNKQEFLTTAKVSALGLAVIGLIGFILSIIQQLIL